MLVPASSLDQSRLSLNARWLASLSYSTSTALVGVPNPLPQAREVGNLSTTAPTQKLPTILRYQWNGLFVANACFACVAVSVCGYLFGCERGCEVSGRDQDRGR